MRHEQMREPLPRQNFNLNQDNTAESAARTNGYTDTGQPSEEPSRQRVCLLRLPQVLKRTGLSRTTIYELIARGAFPAPLKVGSVSAWIDIEITHWIAQLVARRDGATQ